MYKKIKLNNYFLIMNFTTQRIRDEKIKKEIKEMDTEAKRILNLSKRDDLPVELIKIRNTKHYFLKEKLPQLSSIKSNHNTTSIKTNITNKQIYYFHPTKILKNIQLQKTFLPNNKQNLTFRSTMFSFSEPFGFNNGSGCIFLNDVSSKIAHSPKLKHISNMSPEIIAKQKKSYQSIPLLIKKQKKDFSYLRGQVIEDPDIVNRYNQENIPELKIYNYNNKEHKSLDEKKHFNHYSYCPGSTLSHFRVQDYHLKRSLLLKNNVIINEIKNVYGKESSQKLNTISSLNIVSHI